MSQLIFVITHACADSFVSHQSLLRLTTKRCNSVVVVALCGVHMLCNIFYPKLQKPRNYKKSNNIIYERKLQFLVHCSTTQTVITVNVKMDNGICVFKLLLMYYIF